MSWRWCECLFLALAIKGFYIGALKEGRSGNWKTRKPEKHFQQRDVSGARSCLLVSLPLLKPQAMWKTKLPFVTFFTLWCWPVISTSLCPCVNCVGWTHKMPLTQPGHEISLPGIFGGLLHKRSCCTEVNSGHDLWLVVVFPLPYQ